MRRKTTLLLCFFFFFIQSKQGLAWVHDAFKGNFYLVRGGYEVLFQPSHSSRRFSSIQSIQIDFEKSWEYVRLFVYNMGAHFGKSGAPGLPDTDYWDDMRFGAQFQIQEYGLFFGGIRFWTKLPNTRDETALGTDETDFWFIVIQSFGFPDLLAIHLNVGLAIVGDPNLMRSQNDWFVYGMRLDFGIFHPLLLSATIHGFKGFKEHDDKLSLKFAVGYRLITWLTFYFDFEVPLIKDYIDFADPFDHTALGGKLYVEVKLEG